MAKVRSAQTRLWIAAILGLLTLAAYSDSFSGGFTLDSSFVILKDPRLVKAAWDNVRLILTQDYWWPNFHSGLYRPLTTASFLFNYAILGNGENPAGYHVVNFLLHLIDVWLLFLLASRLFGRIYPAFFAAALWAVHPIGTEAVTNLVGRSDELAAMSIFGGVLLYQRSVRLRGWRIPAAAAALFVIAVLGGMSKEVAVVLIGMMLLWDLVRGMGPWQDWLKLRWPFYLAVALALAFIFWARAAVLGTGPPAEFPYVDNPLAYADFWTAKFTAIKVICLDLWLMVFPLRLSSDRSYDQIHLVGWSDPAAYAPLLLAGGLLAVVILRRRKDPLMFWCAGFFAIAVLPVSNLILTIGSIMAERFLYLPAAAFAIAVSALVFRSPWRRHAGYILGALIALYAVRTFIRNRDWQSDLTLASHDVSVTPDSFKMHGILARALIEQSRSNIDTTIHQAEIAWDIVRRLPPNRVFTQTPTNLAVFYRLKGDQNGGPSTSEGRKWYLKSLDLLLEAKRDSLDYGDTYDDLQRAQGKPLTVRLERADLYLNLGLAYHGLGQFEQARDAYIYGRQLAPTDGEFYDPLAANYLSGGNPQWAAITLEEKMNLEGAKPATVADLRNLFSTLPGGSCALVEENGLSKLNIGCPAVNICLVWADMAQTTYRGRRREDAYALKRMAAAKGCPAKLLDAVVP